MRFSTHLKAQAQKNGGPFLSDFFFPVDLQFRKT